MKKVQLGQGQHALVESNSDRDLNITKVHLVDDVLNKIDTIGIWSQEHMTWSGWNVAKVFELCKQYPQLKRYVLKSQNGTATMPVTLQWKCFKRNFKLSVHKLKTQGL